MAGIDSYTKLLIQSNTSDGSTTFADTSGQGHTVVANGTDTHHEDTQKKFGTTSVQFNGTDDYLSIADSSDWDFGTGDFTIDFWAYPTANVSYNIVTSARLGAGQDTNFFIYLQCNWVGAGGNIAAAVRDDGDVDNELLTSTAYTVNTWQHICLCRNGNTVYLFKDGTSIGTLDVTGKTLKNPTGIVIGTEFSNYYAGYVDEYRICKGIDRTCDSSDPLYNGSGTPGAAFTAPSASYDVSDINAVPFNATTSLIANPGLIIPSSPLSATGSLHGNAYLGRMITLEPLAATGSLSGSAPVIVTPVADTAMIYETLGWGWIKSLTSTANITETVTVDVAIPVTDVLTFQDDVDTHWAGTEAVESTLGLFGNALIAQIFDESVTSTANAVDAVSYLHTMISVVESTFNAADTVSSKATFNPVIAESVAITGLLSVLHTLNLSISETAEATDTVKFGWSETISDGGQIVDAAAVRLLALHILTSNLDATETVTGLFNFSDTITDTFEAAATVAVRQILQESIEEILNFGITIKLDDEVWECWVLNGSAFNMSVYSAFEFNSFATFNNAAYGCRSDGIYRLDGSTDNGETIHSGVVLPETSFNSSNKKRFRKAFFCLSGGSPSIRMETESGNQTYSITNSRANLSRSQYGRTWTVKIQDFDTLDQVDLIPIILTR